MVQRTRPPSEWDYSEWLVFRKRLCKAAKRLMKRRGVDRLRNRGAPMSGITEEDLAQHAIYRFLAGKPLFNEQRQSLFEYCVARIDDKIKAATELPQNRPAVNPFVGITHTDEHDENLYLLVSRTTAHSILESADILTHLLSYLEKKDAELVELFRLQIFDGVTRPVEQSAMLEIPIETIYRLRARLAVVINQFFASEGRA
jgi:hypothetical protein